LGDGTIESKIIPVKVLKHNFDIQKIFAGSYHALMINKNGIVFAWGANYV